MSSCDGYPSNLHAPAETADTGKPSDREPVVLGGAGFERCGTVVSGEVALRYKELWRVEQAFRTAKSLLDTRPHLPHVRRDLPRSRVLLVPRPSDAEGVVPTHGKSRDRGGMGRHPARPRRADRNRDRERRQALPGALPGQGAPRLPSCAVSAPGFRSPYAGSMTSRRVGKETLRWRDHPHRAGLRAFRERWCHAPETRP